MGSRFQIIRAERESHPGGSWAQEFLKSVVFNLENIQKASHNVLGAFAPRSLLDQKNLQSATQCRPKVYVGPSNFLESHGNFFAPFVIVFNDCAKEKTDSPRPVSVIGWRSRSWIRHSFALFCFRHSFAPAPHRLHYARGLCGRICDEH